jgi:hypothetical protein
MKSSLSAAQLAVTLLSVTRAVSAVSWPTWLPELDSLVVRRDDWSSQGKHRAWNTLILRGNLIEL